MTPRLHAVQPGEPTVAEKIRQLQAEARALGRDHVIGVVASLNASMTALVDIASAGEAIPNGIRQEAEQLAREIERRVLAMTAIVERVG